MDIIKVHPADVIVPTYEIFELQHLLRLPETMASAADKEAAKTKLLDIIEKGAMSGVYSDCCKEFGWTLDQAKLEDFKKRNDAIVVQLDEALAEAKERLGDLEVKDVKFRKAHHYCQIGEWDTAMTAYAEVLNEKALESGGKIDIFLTLVRIGLFLNKPDLVAENLEKARKQFEIGGDWERRNRMKIYKAIDLAKNHRKFAESAELLLGGLSTFTATELICFEDFVQHAVILSMCSLPRPILKEKVLNSPEVLQVFAEEQALKRFFNAFMQCDYRTFFENFEAVAEKVHRDRYLQQHYRYFVRNMRMIAYKQYLEPFKSVKIPAMAEAFGVSEDFIEQEIVTFIPSGKLACKIDRISRTIESDTANTRNALYAEVVRSGDVLLNKLQMLSLVIDI
eukprot:Blabericola_migrator_1__6245@NODE_314_length_10020_cov_127_741485_g257_i0_p2_GENE_NODE_314_length_10020_cov_127_741485_g257_i0NODE_314_length_10020_cov_127_741485_g257_i0_p2_ORF_typecomplete_len395_score80_98RPN7/PF10602_9/3_6e35PCI/PF01399_27/7_4e03PCI/PF01399_27/5e03PCI/PF01399_27/1_3e19TPR_MalT/PF17874_1/0_0097Foiegras_1/PF11817_8/2_8Foiegras_1/PF11817_8/38Coatomer_E/PF04733_14/0_083SF3A3/PF16837_5/0_31_NODE_314_length_10020_cov_127_741485_g257_i062217405